MSRNRFTTTAVVLSATSLLAAGSALTAQASAAVASPRPAAVGSFAPDTAAPLSAPRSWPAPGHGANVTAADKALVTNVFNQLFNDGNLADIDTYFGPTYTQHNPTVADGTEALRQLVEFVQANFPQFHLEVKRVIAQGDLVLLQSHTALTPGAAGQTTVDIFRVANGRIVEHWDNLQDVPATTVSGHDLFSTLSSPETTSTGPESATGSSERLVTRYFTAVTKYHRTSAIGRFVAPNLYQHDPNIADGAAATRKYYANLFSADPQATYTVARVIAEGDLVAVHSHLRKTSTDLGESVVDIYRVEHGKIVEHWDNTQAVPATAANSNTMF